LPLQTLLPTLSGVFLVAAIAVIASFLGVTFPLVGGPVCGILLGMLLSVWKRPACCEAGISFTAKKILQGSIILLGFEMNLYQVVAVGSQSLYIILFTLGAAFFTAWIFGHYFQLSGNTSILIGVGTAICGGSAIAATAPVISASEKDVAYSLSTIFLFNIAAVLIFPALGHYWGMSDIGFGMWAGTAINDTSSVVAAGYSYSDEAGNFATIVKLTRALMIIPVTLLLALFIAKKNAGNNTFSLGKVFPWFILGFLAASLLCTTNVVPQPLGVALAKSGKFLIIMAMVAVGLNTPIRQLYKSGVKPILLGLSCWLAVTVASVAAQYYLAIW
jgi:uncharacterized integral membrane protein (TIGR00698 family)